MTTNDAHPRSLSAVRPDVAEEWHPTRNGDLGPGDVPPRGLARDDLGRRGALHRGRAGLHAGAAVPADPFASSSI